MYCTYCGKLNHQQDGRFCSYCGKPLVLEDKWEEQSEQETAASANSAISAEGENRVSGEQAMESLSDRTWDTEEFEITRVWKVSDLHEANAAAASGAPHEHQHEAYAQTDFEEGEAAEAEDQLTSPAHQAARKPKGISAYVWLVPLILALLVGALLYGYYSFEKLKNDRVEGLHEEAKRQALLGSYDKAANLLEQAIKSRPKFEALQADRAIVREAAELKAKLAEAADQLGKQHLEDAGKLLNESQGQLDQHTEPLFEPLHAGLQEQRTRLTVMSIQSELDGLTTVSELADKLRVADGLNSEEAEAVHDQIVGRIVHVALAESERLLAKKDYTDATAVVEEGLEYAADNEELQAMKTHIDKEKKTYEAAEQSRIEHAMQKAAEEDLKNRTAAVQAGTLNTTLDEFGDLHVHIELLNVATKTIYSVYAEYTLLDQDGSTIGTGTAYATPDSVEPGDTAVIDDIYYGAYKKATVRVDKAGWYLD
ncbi:FxLYD domain-containing protein [Paenibacillus kobensis]|uniref:FxLYD domain-containing protein n=1 Tax=Paenibacillus kobensis TaxID=59841 RepID=UPI000FD6DE38|nr:FxLYD domain-containing protein [Paenibacillus kobensis]